MLFIQSVLLCSGFLYGKIRHHLVMDMKILLLKGS